MGIDEHWGPNHPERIQAQSRITHRLFFKAVDDVERLVVMRLLELTKLQMNGLGYKLRTQISKALKSRTTAIRNALQCYNKYAAEMMPPRPSLDWNQIVKYSFLAEFDLLRDSNGQIQTKRWANPLYRQASAQYFDHVRAQEELERLNVEVGRLMTKIRDDTIYYPNTIAILSTEDPPLASELSWQWEQLLSVNSWHQRHIHQIQTLHGYSGPRWPGTRLGAAGGNSLAHDVLAAGSAPTDEGIINEEPYDGERMQQVEGYINGLEHHTADDM
ncbi:hypothetical protein EV424DRAFT_1327648 [Suillus variegatus]|nr:hypothetical protein EV424DRAFT_1327648 [Suillus variegatus]